MKITQVVFNLARPTKGVLKFCEGNNLTEKTNFVRNGKRVSSLYRGDKWLGNLYQLNKNWLFITVNGERKESFYQKYILKELTTLINTNDILHI